MKIDVPLDPIHVAPFGVDRVMTQPHHVAHSLEQTGLTCLGRALRTLISCVLRLTFHRARLSLFRMLSWTLRPDIMPFNQRLHEELFSAVQGALRVYWRALGRQSHTG